MTRRWLVAIAAACFAGMLAIRVWLDDVGPLPGDRWAVGHIHHPGLSVWEQIPVNFFSSVALAPVALVTVLVAWRIVAERVSRRAAWLVVLAAAVPIVTTAMKVALGPTPDGAKAFGPGEPGSYPSGHAAYATALFGWFAVLAWRARRWDVLLPCAALVIVMGPMRVLGGQHLPSDVYGGYLLGVGWLAGVLAVERRDGELPRGSTRVVPPRGAQSS